MQPTNQPDASPLVRIRVDIPQVLMRRVGVLAARRLTSKRKIIIEALEAYVPRDEPRGKKLP